MTGVIDIDSGEDYLFGDDVTMDDIIWMGPQPSVKDMAASVHVGHSAPTGELKNSSLRHAARIAPSTICPHTAMTRCCAWKSCWTSVWLN